ncbi:MAG: hypothetical protein EXR82_07110 [Gammaproteobacteria bacterium]|nr:hypothetical protein [Gammaproteobacteria bacterium]
MAFQNYVCWQQDRILPVMNTEAESIEAALFLAVHSEYPLTLVEPNPGARQGVGRRWQVRPHAFLEDFLKPERKDTKAMVQGDSGSGKSHFIKWMDFNIPKTPSRHVLTIPKTGTNLRGVLERIIAVMPQDQQKEYRDQLESGGQQAITSEQRCDRLIAEISLAIRKDKPSRSSLQPAAEQWLIEGLPSMFTDPHTRSFLQKPGSILEQLVAHVYDPSTYDRVDAARAFQAEDLPLHGVDILNMAKETQNFMRDFLGLQEHVPLALAIINRSLDEAIPQLLNFSGHRLIQLMSDVRRHLRQDGKELVLLIEDFSSIQGIDNALLEALLVPSSPQDGLCPLRWAMAVNIGYIERIPPTVQTRMDFLIDMNLHTSGAERVVGEQELARFAARYLNAARLTEAHLRQWHDSNLPARLSGGDGQPPPNTCINCPHRESCHAAFGETGGVGLYPFSQSALMNMANRRDAKFSDRFNPRQFIKFVLVDVLSNYSQDIASGRFPSDQLLRQMGGSRLQPLDDQRLQRAHPADHLRLRSLNELWSRMPGSLVKLPEGVYTAFSLPVPAVDAVSGTPEQARPPEVIGPKPPAPANSVLDGRITVIRAWSNGQVLIEATAQFLRPLLYRALESHIDWDTEGLERSAFSRPTGTLPFGQNRIAFLRQQTRVTPVAHRILLAIPLSEDPEELREAAIALEGLVRFEDSKSWDFPDGQEMLLALAKCLDTWAAEVLRQIRALTDKEGRWNAAASAVELLAVGAVLAGRPPRADSTLPEHLNSLFEEWPEQVSARSPKWNTLYAGIYRERERLVDLVRAWASGTKGGQAGAFVDPSSILPPLHRVRRHWRSAHSPPQSAAAGIYSQTANLHTRVFGELPTAAQEEWNLKKAWLDKVRTHVPAGSTRRDIVDALAKTRQAVSVNGISVRPILTTSLDAALESFRNVLFDEAVRAAEALMGKEPLQVLPDLARERGSNAVEATDKLFAAADAFLKEAEAGTGNREVELKASGGDALLRDQTRIGEALASLTQSMASIGG